LTCVRVPKPPASLRTAHIRQGERESFDWPLADVAVALDAGGFCRRAAIILGAAAPVPHRAKTAEAALTGKRIDENKAAAVGHAALDGATPLSRNVYKLPLFETLVRRAILTAVASQ
jgi:xanthine dehydrogenase YagS FAD-binding subunit